MGDEVLLKNPGSGYHSMLVFNPKYIKKLEEY